MLDSRLRRTLDRARALRDKRRELAKKGGGSQAEKRSLRKDTAALQKALAEYREALAKALATQPLFDVEKAFRDHLKKQKRVLDRLTKDMDEMAKLAGAEGLLDLAKLEKFLDDFEGLAKDMNAVVGEPVRNIVAVVRLLARANEFVRLTVAQKELTKLARRFKDTKGVLSRLRQMELQEVASTERSVRDGLGRFMQELPQLKDKLPDDEKYDELKESVAEFLKKIGDAKIQKDLDVAAEKFTGLDGPGGYPPAKAAALTNALRSNFIFPCLL